MGTWGWDWCQLRFSGKQSGLQLLGWELLERGFTPQYLFFQNVDGGVLFIPADETSFKRLRHYGYKYDLSVARVFRASEMSGRDIHSFSWDSICLNPSSEWSIAFDPKKHAYLRNVDERYGEQSVRWTAALDTPTLQIATFFQAAGCETRSYKLGRAAATYFKATARSRYFLKQHGVFCRIAVDVPSTAREVDEVFLRQLALATTSEADQAPPRVPEAAMEPMKALPQITGASPAKDRVDTP
jgi:hypothetical protein